MIEKMMKLLVVMMICLLAIVNLAYAAESIENTSTTQEVNVNGAGSSRDDAVRDALRNAVEQAVGTLISSETIVSSSTVIKDEIYTKAQGFVQNFDVTSEKETGGTFIVTVKAVINTSPDSALYNKLEALKLIEIGLRDPRIAVVLPEYHITRVRIPDPAGETAIIRKLLAGGFSRIVDAKQLEANYKQSLQETLAKADYSVDLSSARVIQQSLANLDSSGVVLSAKRLNEAIAKNDLPGAIVLNKMFMDILTKSNGSNVITTARLEAKKIGSSGNSAVASSAKTVSDALCMIDFDGAASSAKILEEALAKNDVPTITAASNILNQAVATLDTTSAAKAITGFIDVTTKADSSVAISTAKAQLEALNKGDNNIYTLAAKGMGIDFIIVGEAFSEKVDGMVADSKMLSCRARVEAKIINVNTGDIIATHGFQMGGIDIAEAVAAKRALNNAGEVMGEYLRAQLMTYASKTAKSLRVVLVNVPTFDKGKAFETELQKIPGVKSVYIREYNGGKLTIDIDYTGVPKPLATMIERINSIDIVVNKVTYNSIEATMRY